MKKRFQLLFFLLIVFVLIGCVRQENIQISGDYESNAKIQEPLPSTANNGLGNPCSNESDCRDFCLNNPERCEEYCNTNSENELCKSLFQFEESSGAPEINVINEQKTNCPPIFNYEFTDFSKIDAFAPIGSITGESPGRSYIGIKEGESVPVYVPTDTTLVAVIYAYRGTETNHGEYGFKFDTKCGVTFLFDHLDSISEEMKKYAPIDPSKSSAVGSDYLSIPIKAGTLLGYTDGTSQARTFDFLVLDSTKKTSYINPNRWKWEQSLYSICPYDLYEEKLKEKYYQKIGISNYLGFQKAENCGDLSYDIENTISGGWFLDEQATDSQGEFMLIGERMNAVDLTVKTDIEGTQLRTKFRITDYTPEKSPKDIGIGESVCYTGFDNNWAYFNLVDSNTIELASGQGNCPSSFPATNSKRYYR